MVGFGEERVGPFTEDFHALLAGQRRAGVGNVGARAVALGHDAVALQFHVGAGDGVWIDQQLFRKGTDRRQFLAGREAASGDEILHLVDDLEVDRHAVIG